jgi:hypothetical protein
LVEYREGEARTVVPCGSVENFNMPGKGRHDNVLDSVARNIKYDGRGVDGGVDLGRPVLIHPVAVQVASGHGAKRREGKEGEREKGKGGEKSAEPNVLLSKSFEGEKDFPIPPRHNASISVLPLHNLSGFNPLLLLLPPLHHCLFQHLQQNVLPH